MPIISDLVSAFINENNTKDLLPYKHNMIEELKVTLLNQQKYIKKINKSNSVIKSIYEQDYERVAYFLQEYLKIRLKKIAKNFFIDKNLMSGVEIEFSKGVIELSKENEFYQETSFLNNEYVGFVVLCESKNILIDGNEILMREGDVFVCALDNVKQMLLDNEIL
ncbi:DNA replication complex GINS protein SLD5, partial [Conglomerata obtusa]